MSPTPIDQYDILGKAILADKIDSFISKNEAIDFVMLGFPFKSTNHRDKTFGDLPDLGEELTLMNFANFNNEVKSVYNPGVRINIASDGYIYLMICLMSQILQYRITKKYHRIWANMLLCSGMIFMIFILVIV